MFRRTHFLGLGTRRSNIAASRLFSATARFSSSVSTATATATTKHVAALPAVGALRFASLRHSGSGSNNSSGSSSSSSGSSSSQTEQTKSQGAATAQAAAEGEGESFSGITPEADAVSKWLFFCAGMVFTIVVVGGITRLTESGLSIVEWRPVAGMRPPLTQSEWEAEFAKYQKYPEYSQNPNMDLAHFKFIFFWEWAHRVLARSVGLVFAGPLLYFGARGYFRKKPVLSLGLLGIFCLGGAQGALGWWMVKSGLDPKMVEQRKKATVSAYRLAAHLSLALVLFAAMARLGFGLRLPKALVLDKIMFRELWDLRMLTRGFAASLAGTIVTGAFVAGLDAGLLYNDEFPLMGGRILPPPEHLFCFDRAGVDWWRNFTESPALTQLIHRMFAGCTVWLALVLNATVYWKNKRLGAANHVPRHIHKAMHGVMHFVMLQAFLGMVTIILYVPVSVAALHQANAVLTLGATMRVMTFLGSRGRLKL